MIISNRNDVMEALEVLGYCCYCKGERVLSNYRKYYLMFLQLLVCSLMSITHVRIIITCFHLHNTLSRAYSPLVSDTSNPLICSILALTTPTSSLLNRFLPLLKCRLDLPPPPPPVSQYYSRLNYKGASLGNI